MGYLNPHSDSLLFAAALLLLQPIQIQEVDPVFQIGGLKPNSLVNLGHFYTFFLLTLLGQPVCFLLIKNSSRVPKWHQADSCSKHVRAPESTKNLSLPQVYG